MQAGDWLVVAGAATVAGVAGAAVATPAYRFSVEWGEPARGTCSACDVALPTGPRGWLRLGSGCRACGARTGPPATALAAVAAVAGAGLGWRFGPAPALLPYLLLVPLGCLLAAIDLACMRLPEPLVLPGIGGSLALFAALAAGTGAWGDWVRALLAGLALGGAYLLLALLPGGQLGGGDVTLAALLGVYLGWLGWPFAVLGALLPWLVNAPVVIWLLLARRAGRRSDLPFGPAMLVGAYAAIVGPPAIAAALAR